MNQSFTPALRLLSHYWLEELKPGELDTIRALPELAEVVSADPDAALTNLAAEYQRLFGFNLPPYESIFIDPSVMLMAPATERLQELYRMAVWKPPTGVRSGAPDHLGLELLALADWSDQGQIELTQRLQVEHLALWVPIFILTLQRLDPPPFYATLAELTLDLLLALLPADPIPPGVDPFPDLPPPPKFRGTGEKWSTIGSQEDKLGPVATSEEVQPSNWRKTAKRLLTPRETGLYLTRQDIARLGRTLDLPGVMGERTWMLENLLRLADQYDLLPDLTEELGQILDAANTAYGSLASEYPAWTPYAQAWQQRLATPDIGLGDLISW